MAPDAARMRRAAVLLGLRKNSSDRPSICTQQAKNTQDQTKKEGKKKNNKKQQKMYRHASM
jgi:hypothetical protein